MDPTVELLVRWTVRISMLFYVFFVGYWMLNPAGDGASHSTRTMRWLWTLGLLFFVAHLIAAFGGFHHWSHAHALEHTADRTEETVGWRWGGGLYFNYLFAGLWLSDVVAWWTFGVKWPTRFPRYQCSLHVFFGFMVFNATVVFGPRGWGLFAGACVGVGLLAYIFRAKTPLSKDDSR